MDKFAVEAFDVRGAHSAADSLRGDFDRLIVIFDHHLCSFPSVDGRSRNQVRRARLAAERGRKLSEELAALLQRRA